MSDPIFELLTRGVVDVIVKEDLERKLRGKKKLRVKLGIDPSGSDLHLGHMVVVKKLRQFQDLGHKVVLLFGNFTGQIGDPTGKSETRAPKTQKELEKNAQHYLSQVSSVLDVSKVEVVWNADWLAKLSFGDVARLASSFSVAQMMERDMFQDRVTKNLPVYVHEFLYPLMQGYDSVAIKADVELGGTDQTFNLLAGRTIQKDYGQDPQNIVTVPILEGLDGHIKMGKSEGNFIAVNDTPRDMYGKTMSIPDRLIVRYFELATDLSTAELHEVSLALNEGENPKNLKMKLARRLVEFYHDKKAALAAEAEFEKIFSAKDVPDAVEDFFVKETSLPVIELLCCAELVDSTSDARRLIKQGGVRVASKRVSALDFEVSIPKDGVLVQVGKRRFLNVRCR